MHLISFILSSETAYEEMNEEEGGRPITRHHTWHSELKTAVNADCYNEAG